MSNLDITKDVTMDMEIFKDFCETLDVLNNKPMRIVIITVPMDGGCPSTFSNIPPEAVEDLISFVLSDGFDTSRMQIHDMSDTKPN